MYTEFYILQVLIHYLGNTTGVVRRCRTKLKQKIQYRGTVPVGIIHERRISRSIPSRGRVHTYHVDAPRVVCGKQVLLAITV